MQPEQRDVTALLRDDGLDPGSFGGHPYSETERALGYGTKYDPRSANPYDVAEALMSSLKREAALRYALKEVTWVPFWRRKKVARRALDV